MNVGAAIDKDADTFRKLKRVIIMGGSIKRGYGDVGFGTPTHRRSPNGTSSTTYRQRKDSFAAGVRLYVMPLDSTQLKLDEVKRRVPLQPGHPPSLTALTLAVPPVGPGDAQRSSIP